MMQWGPYVTRYIQGEHNVELTLSHSVLSLLPALVQGYKVNE